MRNVVSSQLEKTLDRVLSYKVTSLLEQYDFEKVEQSAWTLSSDLKVFYK